MECGHVSSFLRSRSVVVCHSSMARKVSTENNRHADRCEDGAGQ